MIIILGVSGPFLDDFRPSVLENHLSCIVRQVSPDLLQFLVIVDHGWILILNFADFFDLAVVSLDACAKLLQDITIGQPYDFVICFRVGH